LDIPFCFDRTPVDPADPGAVLSLVARRRIAPPAGPDEPLRMGGMSLPVTPAILAAVAILNEEVSTPACEIFRRLASSFSRDEIADAIRALDESCFARLHKPGLHT
jgi:hypothetical protein